MKTNKNASNKIPAIIGIILIIISFTILLLPELQSNKFFVDIFTISFLLNYLIAGSYFLFIGIRHIVFNGWRFLKMSGDLLRIFIVLFTISSFSLNRSIHVFAEPVLWLNIYLIVVFTALILFTFRSKFPKPIMMIIYFIFGMGFLISLYFSVVLIRVSIFSILLCWFFGFSLHGTVQLLWLPTFLFPVIRAKNRKAWIGFVAGAVLPLIVLTYFLIQYHSIKTEIAEINQKKSSLPEWVSISQNLNDDYFSRQALKSNIFYETGYDIFNFQMFQGNNNIKKKHDPMIWIADKIFGKICEDRAIQEKVLQSRFKLRHEFIPAFWRGDNLSTDSITSIIEVFPEYRLAYIENTFTIKNSKINPWWNEEQEAIYTFHIPEGGFATSLSLRINNVEQKAVLTTKEKADSAYSTVVGYEIRDPSVVSWAEGNRLIVRVFPCTNQEERKFKIGYTVPLKFKDNQLVFNNDFFEGPDASDAHENIHIHVVSDQKAPEINLDGFMSMNSNQYDYNGTYLKDVEFSLPAPPLSQHRFNFKGRFYQLKQPETSKIDFDPKNIYLDINKSWSQEEFSHLLRTCKGKKLFVYIHAKITEINENNSMNLFINLHEKNFSMFPVYLISDWQNALIITKSNTDTPFLSDLDSSEFYSKTFGSINSSSHKLNIYNISDKASGFYKSLKEYQSCDIINGSISNLDKILNEKSLRKVIIKPNEAFIEHAEMLVSCTDQKNSEIRVRSQAPDHIMRLYAFNKVMLEAGKNHFNKDIIDHEIIDMAKEAYVVSPVSSLIVLETANDYERFDIRQPEESSSLLNANLNNSGSVPEPHEWLLIGIACIIAIFIFIKQRNII